jgi:hypothetical protein
MVLQELPPAGGAGGAGGEQERDQLTLKGVRHCQCYLSSKSLNTAYLKLASRHAIAEHILVPNEQFTKWRSVSFCALAPIQVLRNVLACAAIVPPYLSLSW